MPGLDEADFELGAISRMRMTLEVEGALALALDGALLLGGGEARHAGVALEAEVLLVELSGGEVSEDLLMLSRRADECSLDSMHPIPCWNVECILLMKLDSFYYA